MTLDEFVMAVEGMLEELTDMQLPGLCVETVGDDTVAWFGGRGYHLGATTNGEPDPTVHRTNAIHDLLAAEAVCRLDGARLEVADRG